MFVIARHFYTTPIFVGHLIIRPRVYTTILLGVVVYTLVCIS